ncbi:MAG: hypothetical protein DRJ07_20185 [Bacteroidetes bacterium]|nr:MAG: hypothetical protein DRJ07_20185 [Bacteroidota bacterium]
MKRILAITLFLIVSTSIFAQTDGISYQAVIIDPDVEEIPGVNIEGNILPNATIAIRFTIFDATNAEEFEEVHITETDQFGMINLMIGSVNNEEFTRISWDGTIKDLNVEIDFSGAGSDFIDLSRQELTFVPFAYHRNITATGTLSVDDATNLNSELTVEGPTNLNSSLDVNNNNNTNLTGMLNVDGTTALNNTLTVYGNTRLMDSLSVNLSPSLFDGNITVEDTATFNGPALFNAPVNFVEITVDGPSFLNGQITLDATADTTLGDQDNYNAYPLLVKGNTQGIAIKVNGARSIANNYISFWDSETGEMWGRIEGQTIGDLWADPEHIYETASNATNVAIATADMVIANVDVAIAVAEGVMQAAEVIQAAADLVAASTASTACAGLGACITVPPPSNIAAATSNMIKETINTVIVAANLASTIANAVIVDANLALAIADGVAYEAFVHANIGVTYQSGSGDYAEWLPKANPADKFLPGELVGVRNGYITKNTSGVDKIMVISTNPIILGNMPQKDNEKNYEKVAFMGQVPVKIIGKVKSGDYILPSLFVYGFGTAVHPDKMKISDYKKIVGVAWSSAEEANINVVNVAVGLNTNDLSTVILGQEEKINSLQEQIDQTNTVLGELVPGYKEAVNKDILPDKIISTNTIKEKEESHNKIFHDDANILKPTADEIIYIETSREELLEALDHAKDTYLESGKSIDDHPFWKKMKDEPAYKEEILQFLENKLEKTMHFHKSVDKKHSK